MVAASTAFSPSSTMTASLVESTGLPSAAIPVHEDGNNGNGDRDHVLMTFLACARGW